MHQTELSGFKVFRPTTRDLLFKPGPGGNQSRTTTVSPGHTKRLGRSLSLLTSIAPLGRLKPPSNEHTRRLSFDKSVVKTPSVGTKMNQERGQTKDKGQNRSRKEQVLPELLFQQSPVKDSSATPSHLKVQTPSKIHLPAIVSS